MLKVSEEFDKMKEMKRLYVTGETRITAREHIVSKPFAWAEVREVFPLPLSVYKERILK
jgi:hypothetical protein